MHAKRGNSSEYGKSFVICVFLKLLQAAIVSKISRERIGEELDKMMKGVIIGVPDHGLLLIFQ